VWKALRGEAGVFQRTPKFQSAGVGAAGGTDGGWRRSAYARSAARADRRTLLELLCGAYALFGALLAVRSAPTLVAYFALYAAGFFVVAVGSLAEG
jgi:hypothetical protein